MKMMFRDNVAEESGGGIYVEFPPIRFVIDIFNRLCFLQYRDESGRDVAPQDWDVCSPLSLSLIELFSCPAR